MTTPGKHQRLAGELIRLASAVRLGAATCTETQAAFFQALLPCEGSASEALTRLFVPHLSSRIRVPDHMGVSHYHGVAVTLLLGRSVEVEAAAHHIISEIHKRKDRRSAT